MVLGWFGSAPPLIVSRPLSRLAPESQEVPTVAHFGAWRAVSKTAVCAPPPPLELTVSERLVLRVVAPLVPCAWMVKVPVAAVAVAVTVNVLLAVPLAGGVTEAGLKPQEEPDGMLAHDSVTALEKPLIEVTVQVV